MNDLEICILCYIYEEMSPTVQDIFTDVFDDIFNGIHSRATRYRVLQKLEEVKLIVKKPLYSELGKATLNYYRITQKGSKLIGKEKLPSTYYRYQFRLFYCLRRAKRKLIKLAQVYNWSLESLYEDKDKDIQREKRQQDSMKAIYSYYVLKGISNPQLMPVKIPPDLVLTVERQAYIVILTDPNTKYQEAYFRRMEKYSFYLYDLKFICICSNQEQFDMWGIALDAKGISVKTRFHFLMWDEIDSLPDKLSQ